MSFVIVLVALTQSADCRDLHIRLCRYRKECKECVTFQKKGLLIVVVSPVHNRNR